MGFNRAVKPAVTIPGLIAIPLVLFVFAGCGRSHEASKAGPPGKAAAQSPLIGSHRAADLTALLDSVEARALRGDTLGLLRLFVNDSDYKNHVWPTTPSYEPDRPEVWNFVMSLHKANSNKGLRRMMYDILEPAAGPALRPSFVAKPVPGGTLHESGQAAEMERGVLLFGSALCLEGLGCQVLSFSRAGQKGGSGENVEGSGSP